MPDIVDKATRSRMMAGIGPKNTAPELRVRRYLHAKGLRFLLNDRRLPGKPDIVLPKYRTVVFVHGCFWHMHARCAYFVMPKTRPEFWRAKLNANVKRDRKNIEILLGQNWRVVVAWECALRNNCDETLEAIRQFITTEGPKATEIPPTRRNKRAAEAVPITPASVASPKSRQSRSRGRRAAS